MFEKLCKLIADQFGVEPDTVNGDTAFVDDLGADSVDLVDLSMALEEEFGMEEMGAEGIEAIVTGAACISICRIIWISEHWEDREKVPLRRGFFCDPRMEGRAWTGWRKNWATGFGIGGCWSTP